MATLQDPAREQTAAPDPGDSSEAKTPPEVAKKQRRKPLKEVTYLNEQEIDAFFRVILSPRDKAIFRLVYHRGLRASEPGRLLLTDYRPGDWRGRPRLFVRRCKGSISAEHVLVETEANALKTWLRVRGNKPGALFPSRQSAPNVGISRFMLHKLMLRYCILAGIPRDKAHPHAFKHSSGTHLAKLLGGDIVAIQDHLGHADVRNTSRYIRSADRESRADRLAKWGQKGT